MEAAASHHINRLPSKDGVENVQEAEHRRSHVGSFFVKVFRRESNKKCHGPDKVTARSLGTRMVQKIELSKSTSHKGSESRQIDTLVAESSVNETRMSKVETVLSDVDSSAKGRRTRAETRLRKSAEGLSQAIAKTSGTFRVPDTIGLQNITDDIHNIPQTARNIEAAIDGFIDARQYNVSMNSRAMWKSCTSNLFKAFYPYVKECLTDVVVSLLPRNADVERGSKPLRPRR